MKSWCSLFRCLAVAVLLVLLAGCAPLPNILLPSIEPIVGKWSGIVDLGGPLLFIYVTINPDQTFVARWGINSAYGNITLTKGQASYQMSPPPLEGTMRYYEQAGKPTLDMTDTFASFHAVLTRQ